VSRPEQEELTDNVQIAAVGKVAGRNEPYLAWLRVYVDTGSKSAAPEIETKWVFILTNREIQLAATVASSLSETTKYACFFEFPSVEYP
jgi:hypothetical protein